MKRQWAERVVLAVNAAFPEVSFDTWNRCERFLSQALALEPTHPFLAASLNNLAEVYLNQGRYEQAEPLYLRSLAMREQVLGTTHARVAQSLANLAHLRSDQGRYEQAESLYQRALALYEQVPGAEHPDTARIRAGYANHHRKMQAAVEAAQPGQ